MKLTENSYEPRVQMALDEFGAGLVSRGHRCWNFAISNGKPLSVTARIADDFLLLDAPANFAGGVAELQQLLEWGGDLGGTAKFALVGPPWRVRLRSEFVLGEDDNLSERLRASLGGLLGGASRVHAGHAGDGAHAAWSEPRRAGTIAELLKQSKWTFKERDSGNVVVDLESRTGFYQATIAESAGGVLASVQIAHTGSATPASRHAMAVFLLAMNGALRLVRSYMTHSEAHLAVGFQVRLGVFPGPGEIDHALAALSVACQVSARETRALLDESIAGRYLAILNQHQPWNEKDEKEINLWVSQKQQPESC